MIQYMDAIRDHYRFLTPQIESVSMKVKYRWVSPYGDVPWEKVFSPIELDTWSVIRNNGKCPLYPQYPVGKRFLDFGNPVVKVNIECDGVDWHKDKAKDYLRDKALYQDGWFTYRVTGSDCVRVLPENFDEEKESQLRHLRESYAKTIDGVVRAISILHFKCYEYFLDEEEIEMAYNCLLERASFPEDQRLYSLYENALNYYHSRMSEPEHISTHLKRQYDF